MKKITKLKQIEQYPIGDCVRSVFACLMGLDSVEEIPNFMRDGEEKYNQHLQEWLDENNLSYIEIDFKAAQVAYHIPEGYCGIAGKSPRGDYDHLVIGEVKYRYEDEKVFRDFHFIHDTSPYHDSNFIDGEPKTASFLVKKL